MKRLLLAASLAATAMPVLAHAQSLNGGVEIASDENRRGISWSEGKVSASADVSASLIGFDLSGRAVALRDSPRQGGADSVIDLEAGRSFGIGGLELRGYATGHFFTGARGRMDYGELGANAGFSFGPARARAGLTYAPSQSALDGDNAYAYADATVGIPGTSLTASAGAGYSWGSNDGPRAARLRPAGDYTDWHIGIERVRTPLTLGLLYTGTDIDENRALASRYADARHAGDRVIARARLSF